MYKLASISIRKISGIGPKKEEQLNKLGIFTVKDLLYNIPREYLDYTKTHKLNEMLDSKGVYKLRVVAPAISRRTRSSMELLTIPVTDGSSSAELVYFNQNFLKKRFKVGAIYYIYGSVERTKYGVQINNPEILTKDDIGTLKPIYNLTEGLTNNELRKFIAVAFNSYKDLIVDYLPESVLEKYGLISLRQSIRGVHYPTNYDVLKASNYRLSFNELLEMKTKMTQAGTKDKAYPQMNKNSLKKIQSFINKLPFTLTGAQSRSINEILNDMSSESSMNRLLQGDVGSGKTIIAAVAILMAIYNGYQAAFMAPTEILATQQYQSFVDSFNDLGIKTVLLTGDISARNKKIVYEDIKKGSVDLVVGTHALIQDDVEFSNLGLTITDEQHRFGVKQRKDLVKKGNNPHNLVMTATPIPRTLALVMYADMDISIIDELPPMRKPVETIVINQGYQDRLDNFVLEQIEKGHQVFVVCPLIEDENETGLNSLEEILSYYRGAKFKDIQVDSVHGKDSNEKKSEVMDKFLSNKVNILVATTVIEVGINVPNANLMIIYDADRFGLSQLHQLRGRVGRGSDKAYCVLVNNNNSDKAFERMAVMKESEDGFYIAEMDLKLRGEGDLHGLRQHGVPSLQIASLVDDLDIIELINEEYESIVTQIKTSEVTKEEFNHIVNG